jgi:hypothetical protein
MSSCCDLQAHNCRQGRDCATRLAAQRQAARTCDELGVCQNKTPPCAGCTAHYFAPGVIEGGPKKRQARALVRWTLISMGLMATVAVVTFAMGYLS